MPTADAFIDLFGRMPDLMRDAVAGLTEEQLTARIDPDANSVAWLVWHLTRVQDDHVSAAAAALGMEGFEQVWAAQGFHERFGLPFPVEAHGYGHTSAQVAQVRGLSADDLLGYHSAVHEHTMAFLDLVTEDDWHRVVDDAWDPPVTLLVRLASVVGDVNQHAGQAAFLRGHLERG